MVEELNRTSCHVADCHVHVEQVFDEQREESVQVPRVQRQIGEKIVDVPSPSLQEEVGHVPKIIPELRKANEIEKAMVEIDVEYKTNEPAALEKAASESNSDCQDEQAQMDAILEFMTKLRDQRLATSFWSTSTRITKPETYEEPIKRRTAEIAGVKEALQTCCEAMKEIDVEYKTNEPAALANAASESNIDCLDEQAQMDAILEFLSKLRDQRIEQPETYEEPIKRRTTEITGVKEALQTSCKVDDSEVYEDEEEEEELADVPQYEKESDPLYHNWILRVVDEQMHRGQVVNIQQGMISKDRLYLVQFEDGDMEHCTAEELMEGDD